VRYYLDFLFVFEGVEADVIMAVSDYEVGKERGADAGGVDLGPSKRELS
jgi:hypothetical protein